MKTQYRYDMNQDFKNKYPYSAEKNVSIFYSKWTRFTTYKTLIHTAERWGWGTEGILFKKKYWNDICIHSSEIMQILFFKKTKLLPNNPTSDVFFYVLFIGEF